MTITTPAREDCADIHLSGRHLEVGGRPVLIGARAYDVLSLLMKHRERVVTKKELLEAAWPGLVVEENNLQVQISTLRKVLGHDAITTIPGLGYQFTAHATSERGADSAAMDSSTAPQVPLQTEQTGAGPPALAGAAVPQALSGKSRRGALLALEFTILLAGGFGAWRLLRPGPAPAAPPPNGPIAGTPPDRSIAVLPFADMSENKDMEYFSDGLSEEVLDLLSRAPELRVAARTSSFSFKGKPTDLPTIAHKLRVANILEGSVRRAGKQLRITAQLVNAENGYHVWSQTYDRNIGDIFQIQDEIAASVVQALHQSLLGEGLPKSAISKSVGAYALYLQARSLQTHASTKADWEKVDEYVRRAISADVAYAPAWALFSQVLSTRSQLGYIAGNSGWEAARQSAIRSLALEPGLAEGHAALASILICHDWNWVPAQAQIDIAMKLDPSNAQAISCAGCLAQIFGQSEKAISLFENAIANDPLDAKKCNLLAQALCLRGRFAEARDALQKALALDSRQPFVHGTLGKIALASGNTAVAHAEFDQEPYEAIRAVGRALVFIAQDRRSDADEAIAELESNYADHDAAGIASVHAFRGEIDQAFAWLERAYDERDSDCIFVKVEPLLQGLRPDPRYKDFLRKMNLPA